MGRPGTVGAVITTRRSSRSSVRFLAIVGATALAFAVAACGSDSDSAGGPGGGPGLPPGDFVLVADNVAWNTDEIAAPADEEFVIVIDNQDAGVQHNLNIKETEFVTELEAGVSAQVLPINVPAGEYDYICDLHPNMVGTLTAS